MRRGQAGVAMGQESQNRGVPTNVPGIFARLPAYPLTRFPATYGVTVIVPVKLG